MEEVKSVLAQIIVVGEELTNAGPQKRVAAQPQCLRTASTTRTADALCRARMPPPTRGIIGQPPYSRHNWPAAKETKTLSDSWARTRLCAYTWTAGCERGGPRARQKARPRVPTKYGATACPRVARMLASLLLCICRCVARATDADYLCVRVRAERGLRPRGDLLSSSECPMCSTRARSLLQA